MTQSIKGRFVTWEIFDGRRKITERGFLPKYQVRETEHGLAHLAGHPRHLAVFDAPGGKMIACISPSCSFYDDLKKHVSFKPL